MKKSLLGQHLRSSLSLAILLLLTLGRPLPAAAAPGDLIADVTVPEPDGTDKAVARDGQYLYYAEHAGTVLHRIDVPPPGASDATGHVDIPIVGAPEGIMTIAYDAGRDMFWAVSSDGTTIYLVSKTGSATPQFTIDTVNGLPDNCKYGGCSSEVKIAYDRSDDTIWYSPDTTLRVYHFQTTGDAQGHGVLVASSPYVDVDIAPNDFSPQCPYSYVSGIATGGSDLFFENSSCTYYFEYSKSGVKVAAIPISVTPSGGLTCDNLSYGVSVIWMREGWTHHIYALEQPYANACVYGG